ncbi:MAG: hypothetical protein WBN29_02955, partial [Polyangiales bacterium]
MYETLTAQTLHYFARPQERVLRQPQSESELFLWCFGQHFGIPGAQNPQAARLGRSLVRALHDGH